MNFQLNRILITEFPVFVKQFVFKRKQLFDLHIFEIKIINKLIVIFMLLFSLCVFSFKRSSNFIYKQMCFSFVKLILFNILI